MPQRDPGVYLEDIEHYSAAAVRFIRVESRRVPRQREDPRSGGKSAGGLWRGDEQSLQGRCRRRDDTPRARHYWSPQYSRAWLCGVGSYQGLQDRYCTRARVVACLAGSLEEISCPAVTPRHW
jgi:hypothetical protein